MVIAKDTCFFVGRNPGVYNSWEEAHLQVNRYSGASHKSYQTKEEAVRAFNAYREKQHASFTPRSQNSSSSSSGSTLAATSSSSQKLKQSEELAKLIDAQLHLANEYHNNALKIAEIYEDMKKKLDSLHVDD
ncbi:ribonuclease H-like [Zingiber officinale]|uniref:ribonuclease H-like n=1 Tax=Zingiber officinale TaxID=94328 RepID=UPI001C4A9723|nr:ribonuclease H-like [Zingiber officinale]